MNPAYLHLIVNHAPLYCSLIAAALLRGALARKNRSLLSAALWLIVVAGITAFLAQLTGERAEHVLEHAPGINAPAIIP